ncbi:hypothetical protein M3G54_01620 [Brevibacterium casei]|uniref:hypothetical protein n=1 Tax=Brevibacterium casei TaxID=33889 RepID=UPI00223A7E09|nr:hypothetical protein [Brevibacterium casei]MCT2357062.1 hypothetical protein [Brevibacterium casei]
MSEKKYTAEDFANVEFATKNGLFAACRSRSGFWRTESGVALVDRDMAEEGWVPVPSSPAKPTITESEIAKAFGPEYVAWARLCLARIGVTVVPDPEPTNAEKLAEAITNAAHGVGIGSTTANIKAIAEHLDRLGVKAPGGDDDL